MVKTRDGYELADEMKFVMNSGLFGVCKQKFVKTVLSCEDMNYGLYIVGTIHSICPFLSSQEIAELSAAQLLSLNGSNVNLVFGFSFFVVEECWV